MLRALVPLTATGWMVLFAIETMAERTPQIHQPALWFNPAILIAAGWILGWLRSDALETVRGGGSWLLWVIGLVPVLGLSGIPMFYGEPHDPILALQKTFLFLVPFAGIMLGASVWSSRDRTPAQWLKMVSSAVALSIPSAKKRPAASGTLVVAVGDTRRILQSSDILWLEADGNYVRVHTADRSYFIRQSLREALDRLGSADFAQIHKSCVVNRAEIGTVRFNSKGDGVIGLRDGHQLKMSRRFRHELQLCENLSPA